MMLLRFAAIAVALTCESLPAAPIRAAGPITTPVSAVQFYEQSVNRGLCAQAYKLIAIGQPRPGLRPFLRQCAATKHLTINPIVDSGYRIQRLNAAYTCLGVHWLTYFRDGTVQSSGGWYFMEKTPLVFWHILLPRSHIVPDTKAEAPPQATCAAAIPPYAHPSSAQLIIGSDFLSATAGWIATSRSGAYVPNGSCAHGIGANCDTAQTVIYTTKDAGTHWQSLLSLTTTPIPLAWIRFFNGRNGLFAAGVDSHDRGILFSMSDGGRTWRRWALPAGYFLDPSTITFPDPRHGWVYTGSGAMGSMAVTIFGTVDGGKRWTQVACTTVSFSTHACRPNSGIPFGGDKTFLTFANDQNGWLTIASNGGIPALLHTSDGGRTWSDQHIGLPPKIRRPSMASTIFPMGAFDQPHIFGQVGILAESVSFYPPAPRAGGSGLYLYRSTDAGASWRFYQHAPLPAPSVAQYASGQGSLLQFPDVNHWIAISGNVIWWTANAGRTWSHAVMHLPARLHLLSLNFVDPLRGWSEAAPEGQSGGISGGTALLHTRDGGRDWLRIAVP